MCPFLSFIPGLSSDIEVHDILGIGFDEFFPPGDIVTHQEGEHAVGIRRIDYGHLQERPLLGVHGRLPELLGGHFAQAFVTLNA